MPIWVALSLGAAVFVGCGVIFAFQDLGTATDYATIASFFLALLTAAGSLLSFARSKREHEAAPDDKGSQKPALGRLMIFGNVGGVQQGNRTRMDVTMYPPDGKKGKRKR
jgi:hypothetical protein